MADYQLKYILPETMYMKDIDLLLSQMDTYIFYPGNETIRDKDINVTH